ncbi:MAG: hypothetical protein RMK91_11110 [Pseudanabaenaceae cyanobacterium SKYGB_i_bin29]|nr:hypothetical protein [Pseudanabaenaceae cyanobacterium SKYG29]MDW8422403.1 hypothetical protein [Pseudanabaenaceae cyanobacterium SKYGB_i_bin29]
MERSKWVAIVTGVISLLLGIAYLVLVQILDWRGEMVPAPLEGLLWSVVN